MYDESIDTAEVDSGMSEVAPVDSDGGVIDVNEGAAAVELAIVVPVFDGAICVSKEGPGGFVGCGFDFLSNPFESMDMADNRAAASSLSSEPPPPPTSFTSPDLSFISLLVSLDMGTTPELPADPGLLPSPSILLIPNASLSNMGLDPNDPDGEGSGWELCMDMDSERGVWLPPRPFDGGTPTSLVRGDPGFNAARAISV
jgi:hypothetical protein